MSGCIRKFCARIVHGVGPFADSLAALCMPEDLVNCFPFLVPDEEAFVNGATLMVEGGASADMPAC